MTNLTLCRRYAKALLAIGREDGRTDLYGRELAELAKLLADHPGLGEALTNPAYPRQARRAVLEGLLAKAGPAPVMKSFFLLLQDKDRLRHLGEISRVYGELTDELAGLVRAEVALAAPADESGAARIKAALESYTGKRVVLTMKEDPGLIGGLVARVGDLVLDGSVRTQLKSMLDTLKGVE